MILKVEYNSKNEIKSKRIHCVEGTKSNSKVACNRKSKGINEQDLTKIVLRNLENKKDKILNIEKIESLIKSQYEENNTIVFDTAIKNYEKQLNKIEKNITSLYEDYRNEILEEDDYKRFYRAEVERKTNIKNNIIKLKEERNNRPKLSKDRLESIVKQLSDIDSLNRDTLSDIIYSVEVDIQNNIYINYRYDIFDKV